MRERKGKITGFFIQLQEDVRNYQEEAQIMRKAKSLSHQVIEKVISEEEAKVSLSKIHEGNEDAINLSHSYLDGFLNS